MDEKRQSLIEKYGAEVVAEVDALVRVDLEKEYQAQLDADIADRNKVNSAALKEAIDEFKKSQMPPTQEDIAKVLSQEYLQHTVKIHDGLLGKEREFTLRELPIKIEKKLYALVRDKLIPRIKDLNMMQGNFQNPEETFQSFFALIDPASELLGEACAIILDPWGHEKIDSDWVLQNLSSIRVWNIISAQLDVNRMRDFFSGVSRTSQRGMMTPAANIRK